MRFIDLVQGWSGEMCFRQQLSSTEEHSQHTFALFRTFEKLVGEMLEAVSVVGDSQVVGAEAGFFHHNDNELAVFTSSECVVRVRCVVGWGPAAQRSHSR